MYLNTASLQSSTSIARASQPAPKYTVSSATLVPPDSCPQNYAIPKFTEHTLLFSNQYVAGSSFFFLGGHSNLCIYNMGSPSVYVLPLLINE